MLTSNFSTNVLKIVCFCDFLRLLQAGYHPSRLNDSGSSYDMILNLADVADVFVANSIPQSVVRVMHLRVLVSVVPSRPLVMIPFLFRRRSGSFNNYRLVVL